jgi:hypothetical protein
MYCPLMPRIYLTLTVRVGYFLSRLTLQETQQVVLKNIKVYAVCCRVVSDMRTENIKVQNGLKTERKKNPRNKVVSTPVSCWGIHGSNFALSFFVFFLDYSGKCRNITSNYVTIAFSHICSNLVFVQNAIIWNYIMSPTASFAQYIIKEI